MALADPQSVTISGSAVSLPRTGLSLNEGDFRDATGDVKFNVKHSTGKRNRHIAQLRKAAIVSDPLVPAQNLPVEWSVHIVVDMPRQGVTNADALALAKALVTWATDPNLTKVIAGES